MNEVSGSERQGPPFRRITIVGLGLMGGSLARTLKGLASPPEIVGLASSDRDTESALASESVDRIATSPDDSVAASDLLVFATPLSATLELLPEYTGALGDATLVTDLASLKGPVVERARAAGLSDRFVGSHPLVGGEGSGFRASRIGLYRGGTVWLSENTGSDAARTAVFDFWTSLGASPRWIDASEHDRRMVWVSHLPQLVATVLARVLDGADIAPADLGPGGRDMTRLAASSPSMWKDLLPHASALDAAALRLLSGELEAVASALDGGRYATVAELMEDTRAWRMGTRSP